MEEVLRTKSGLFVSKRDEMGNPYLQQTEEKSCYTCKWCLGKHRIPSGKMRYICLSPDDKHYEVYAFGTPIACINWNKKIEKRQRKEEEKKEKEHSCLNCKWLISKCYLPIVNDVRYICANPSNEPGGHPVYAYETTDICDNWKSAK